MTPKKLRKPEEKPILLPEERESRFLMRLLTEIERGSPLGCRMAINSFAIEEWALTFDECARICDVFSASEKTWTLQELAKVFRAHAATYRGEEPKR